MRHSEKGLNQALEKALRSTGEAMDCNQLYSDFSEVREYAATPNRVSDYLGGMWRRGLVTRVPSTSEGTSRARWRYQWKENALAQGTHGIEYAPRMIADRPNLAITEEGNTIHITFPNLVITIRQTGK